MAAQSAAKCMQIACKTCHNETHWRDMWQLRRDMWQRICCNMNLAQHSINGSESAAKCMHIACKTCHNETHWRDMWQLRRDMAADFLQDHRGKNDLKLRTHRGEQKPSVTCGSRFPATPPWQKWLEIAHPPWRTETKRNMWQQIPCDTTVAKMA